MPQISCTGCRDSDLKEVNRITAQAGHNLALHELKQIRCTGRADSTPSYLDLRPPPETFDALFKKVLNVSAPALDFYVDGAKSVLGGVLRMQIRFHKHL